MDEIVWVVVKVEAAYNCRNLVDVFNGRYKVVKDQKRERKAINNGTHALAGFGPLNLSFSIFCHGVFRRP